MKKQKLWDLFTILVVSLFIFSFFNMTYQAPDVEENEHRYDEEKIFMINVQEKEDLENLFEEYEIEVLQEYEDKFLAEGPDFHINKLEKRGYDVDTLPSRTEINVKGRTFDVFDDELEIPSELKIEEYGKERKGTYLLHMIGPIHPEWRNTLEEKNVEIVNYVPNYAYEVRMTPQKVEEIKDLFFVDWIDIYHPAYKVPENGLEDGGEVEVTIFSDQMEENFRKIDSFSSIKSYENIDQTRSRLTVNTSSSKQIKRIARIPETYFISETVEPELHSEIESQIIGGGTWIMDDEHDDPNKPYRKHGEYGAYINQIGYDGSDVTIAIADTGIGTGEDGNAGHPDFTERVKDGHGFGEINNDSWGDGHGHGTHVAGSAAGNTYAGTGSEGEYPGFAPYFMGQGLGYESELFSAKIFDDTPSFLLETKELEQIFEIPRKEGDAYIHSNSWGDTTYGEYRQVDRFFDSAVRDSVSSTENNEPMVITTSAGNSGSREQTITSPGNAKNVITIGATENFLPDGRNYGGRNKDNPDNIASFSSRGWTEDNRIKPDVVAPGRNVLSLGDSSQQYGGTYDWSSGTSMSNPAVAGASAVIVDWYEENFGERPSPAMVRALLINTAENINNEESYSEPIPNKDEGWGMVDISKLEYPKEDPIPFFIDDQNELLETGDVISYDVIPDREDEPLKITLGWTDKEAQEGDNPTLKNNLDLKVISPSGRVYRGNSFEHGWSVPGRNSMEDFDRKGDGWDDVNNVNNVFIHPEDLESTEKPYTIKIEATNIPADANDDGRANQDYSLTVYNTQNDNFDPSSSESEIDSDEDSNIRKLKEENERTNSQRYDLEEKEPIQIKGDEELEEKAIKENWQGSGIKESPYIIEEYKIDGDEEKSPISITNVSSHLTIRENLLTNSDRDKEDEYRCSGIFLSNTENVKIQNNILSLNSYGLYLENSKNNLIEKNEFKNNHEGVHLSNSEQNKLEENTIQKVNYPVYGKGLSIQNSYENHISENLIRNNDEGINFGDSNKNMIQGNNISYNNEGISMRDSQENEIDNNDIYKSRWGIAQLNTTDNIISNCNLKENERGIYLRDGKENIIENNDIKRSESDGIRIFDSENISINNNDIYQDDSYSITFSNSEEIKLKENEFTGGGLYIRGNSIEYWNTHQIPQNNKLEDESIIYLANEEDSRVKTDAGQIILGNSTEIKIENQILDSGLNGLQLGFSDENKIISNVIKNHSIGIRMSDSDHNVIRKNEFEHNSIGTFLQNSEKNVITENSLGKNDDPALYISSSNQNLIYGNEFVRNDVYSLFLTDSIKNTIFHNRIYNENLEMIDENSQAFDDRDNLWDDGSEGNYWSDYRSQHTEAEQKNDVIWDEPYRIDGSENKDRYPLKDDNVVDDFRVQFINPLNTDTIFESEFTARWNSKGGIGEIDYRVRLNDENWIDPEKEKYEFSGLTDGSYSLEVEAEDDESITRDEITFEINTDVHTEIDFPENNETIRRSRFTGTWDSHNENHTEIKLEYLDNQSEYGEWENVGKSDENDFRDLEDGNYSFYVRAVDEKGEEFTDKVNISIKTVEVEITYPEDDEEIKDPYVKLQWESENAEKFEFRIDRGRWDELGNASNHKIDHLPPGEYDFTVRAVDKMGYRDRDRISITYSPKVDVLTPRNNSIINSDQVEVKWRNTTIYENISNFEIKINQGEWENVGSKTNKTYENLSEGTHSIKIRAVLDDDEYKTTNIFFTVDTTPPEIDILSPPEGKTITGQSIMVRWEGTDEVTDISHYEVRIENEPWKSIGGEEEKFKFEDLEPGDYAIEIRAWDEAGNRATDRVSVSLEEWSLTRDYWWVFVIIGLLSILILQKISWKSKKKMESKDKTISELRKEIVEEEKQDLEKEYKLSTTSLLKEGSLSVNSAY